MATTSIPAMLETAAVFIDKLEDEYRRLTAEHIALEASGWSALGFLGVAELQTRADSLIALIDRIEHYMLDVVPSLEDKALHGDAAAAARLVTSSKNIVTAITGFSPVDDVFVDVVKTVKDIVDDSKKTGASLLEVAILVIAAGFIVRLVLG